ncbi:tripartite tricarboxylate transporter permease [Candidatus Woesearchaeota archaeon]|nr:tripartite tricarboxylate transporter permease [Candidatus Woesearchaeota archaeon]MBI2661607.1 tripartite tricarboxylate transporter permease [Candidatus Woesearchaeota archaeon]
MFLELCIAILLGCIAGVITGVTPGLHINLVAVILFGLSPLLLGYSNVIVIAGFIISMSITHTFTDFISSVYLGAPADDTALSVLPGHRMLLEGIGHEAVKLTVIGSLLALIIAIMLVPGFLIIVPMIFEGVKEYVGWILILIVAFMIARGKDWNERFWMLFTYSMSGILGIIVFSIPNLKDPLLPMFSGLFGISALLHSLSQKISLPTQRDTDMVKVSKIDLSKSVASSVVSGSLVSIFPGLGPAQAAVLGSQLVGKINSYGFLIMVGGINTVSMIMSLITLYTIEKARNGSIVIVQKLVHTIDISTFVLFVVIALISGCIAAVIALKVSKAFSRLINMVNYRLLSVIIIFFVLGLVVYFTGWIGLAVVIVSTAIGIVPVVLDTNRSALMGCLLMPIILYYLL